MCGDPGRAELIAARLTHEEELGRNREYVTFRGGHEGVDIVVASHGVGAPGAMVCFQELITAGVRTLIRVGTCGALADGIEDGDLVVADACVRDDGVTHQMVPATYPAAASAEVVLALVAAASDRRAHRGIVWTKAAFYRGVLPVDFETYRSIGVVAVEMELAALLVVAAMRGARAGGVLVVDGSPLRRTSELEYDPHRQVVADAVESAIDVALGAVSRLAADSDR